MRSIFRCESLPGEVMVSAKSLIAYRLSPIAYRLSLIAYRLSLIAYESRLPPPVSIDRSTAGGLAVHPGEKAGPIRAVEIRSQEIECLLSRDLLVAKPLCYCVYP